LDVADRIRRSSRHMLAISERGLEFGRTIETINLRDPSLNLYFGAHYYNFLMQRFDNDLLILASYNGGMNRVRRWRAANNLPVDLFNETIPIFETRDYGKRVLGAAAVYQYLYY